MESDDNVSGEFQRSTRMPLDAVVRLHFQGTVAYQNGFAANVSATGMFVKHPAPPPLGTQLVFEFNLGADRKPVQGAGEVVWVREKYLGPGQPAGVGIRFLQLDSQSRDHIAEALFEYLEQSLTEDSLLDSSGFSFATETSTDSARENGAGSAPMPADTEVLAYPAAGVAFDAPAPAASQPDDKLAEVGDIYGDPTPAAPAWSGAPDESFAFPPLERLPQGPAAAPSTPTPADGKRSFSVFSSLDEADPKTAEIVREALRAEEPLPMMAAAAAASEQKGSRAWLGILLLVLVAGAGFLGWKQWGADWLARRSAAAAASGIAEPAPAPAPVRKPDPLPAVPGPEATLAETVGVDTETVSPAAAPPQAAASSAPPAEPTAASPASPAVDSPPPADEAPRPPAAATDPAPARATAAPARQLTGISWRESTATSGETVLVLVGDGEFSTGMFSYSEIGGENPRVLVKLKGMQSPYRGPAPSGAGALVRGVRTGFHSTPAGNEIHVVVDLARGGVKVSSLAPEAAGLALTLAP